jgi:hypothetical protein
LLKENLKLSRDWPLSSKISSKILELILLTFQPSTWVCLFFLNGVEIIAFAWNSLLWRCRINLRFDFNLLLAQLATSWAKGFKTFKPWTFRISLLCLYYLLTSSDLSVVINFHRLLE